MKILNQSYIVTYLLLIFHCHNENHIVKADLCSLPTQLFFQIIVFSSSFHWNLVGISQLRGFPCDSMVKNLPEMQGAACQVGDTGLILGREDPPEKEMATYSSILA